MVSIYDPCTICEAKKYNGGGDECPLPKLCIYDAYGAKQLCKFSPNRIKAILLWEHGWCVEDIKTELGYPQIGTVYYVLNSWRGKMREAGLLV